MRGGGSVREGKKNKQTNVPKVGLAGCAALHGLVVGMQMGVVVDLQRLGTEGGRDLCGWEKDKC